MSRSSDYIFTLAKKLFIVLSGTAASALIARYLGPEMRAEYAFILNAAAILVVLLNFGLSNYYQSLRREEGPGACAAFVAASIKLAVLLLLTVLLLTGLLDVTHSAILIVACFSLLRMQLQAVSLVENIRGAAISTMIGSSIEVLAIALLWLLAEPAVAWVLWSFIAKELAITALSFRAIARAPDQAVMDGAFSLANLLRQRAVSVIRAAVARSGSLFLLTLAIVLLYKVDVLILAALGVDPGQIGIFVIGVLVAEYLWIFSDIFKDVQTSRTARGEAAHGVAAAHRSALFLTMIFYLLFLLLGRFAIDLVFGREFSDSYRIAVFMLMANVFMIPAKILGAYLISTYDLRGYLAGMLAAVALNTGLNFLLVPVWGIDGALAANILSYSVGGAAVTLVFMSRTGIGLGELLLVTRQDIAAVMARIMRRRRG